MIRVISPPTAFSHEVSFFIENSSPQTNTHTGWLQTRAKFVIDDNEEEEARRELQTYRFMLFFHSQIDGKGRGREQLCDITGRDLLSSANCSRNSKRAEVIIKAVNSARWPMMSLINSAVHGSKMLRARNWFIKRNQTMLLLLQTESENKQGRLEHRQVTWVHCQGTR